MPDPSAARWVRQTTLTGFGVAGQARLSAARVVVAGAGGLGSALLPVLAAAGIGELVVVDDDRVEVSNLHRQTLYGPADVGSGKAEVAAARLRDLGADALALSRRVDADSAPALLRGATLAIDATDDAAARYALDDAADAKGIPLVWGSATGTTGQVGVALRGSPRWRDLFPVPPSAADIATCETVGVLPSLCTTIGGLMATEALKVLTGLGRPLAGRMLVVDALTAAVREIEYGASDGVDGEDRMAKIEEISAEEAAAELAGDADVTLVDVREPWETAIAVLPGAQQIPLGELADRVGEIDRDKPVIAYCHGGVRSLRAAQLLQHEGYSVRSMRGGIDAWSRTVDPSVARY